MKILVVLALLCTVSSSFALKISKSIYRVDQIDKALAEAAEKERPLTVLYTNSKLQPT